MQKLFAIGDIHGHFDKLVGLIDKIGVDFERDRIVFLGDYIDRGPDAYQVVEYLIDLKKKCPRSIFLKGNHEYMLEKYLAGGDSFNYLVNGGRQTVDSYLKNVPTAGDALIPPAHREFFNSLLLFYETKAYIFVHAGLKPKIPLEKQRSRDMLWIRNSFIRSSYHHGKKVVFGHTPVSAPLVEENKIGLDTGVAYGGRLTCVQLPQEIFFQA